MFSARRFASTASSTGIPLYRKPVVWAALAAWTGAGYYLSRNLSTSRSAAAANTATTANTTTATAKSALSKQDFTSFKLVSRKHVSHNTAIFRFAFPNPTDTLGMSVASCLTVKADMELIDPKTGEKLIKPVMRPYTPISDPDSTGHVDLLIKHYPDGAMSTHIFNMKHGDTLLFKGPWDKIKYEPNKWNHIGMLAGGTGITPMLQVIHEALKHNHDHTKISLIFANVSEQDILCQHELDQLAKQYPDRLQVKYTLDKPTTKEWNGYTGFISSTMLKDAHLDQPEDGKIVFVCGPPGFMKAMSGGKAPDKSQGEVEPSSLLGKLGYTKDNVFKF